MTTEKDYHVRIPIELDTKLQLLSLERGIAKKWLIVSALEDFLGGGKKSHSTEMKKEVYEVKRRLAALRGDVEILGELLSFFIFHWLGYTPRLEKAERATLAVEAKERHQKFMEMFLRKLKLGDLGLAGVYAEMGKDLEPEKRAAKEND